MCRPLAPFLLLSILMTSPVLGGPPTFSNIALGTAQDLVLLGREGVKLVASDGDITSIRTDYEETLETGDKVRGEEVFHFRSGTLVGGDRRIRVRRGKEDRQFFWRVYVMTRLRVAKACSSDLVTHEPGAYLTWDEVTSAGTPFVPGPVWRGEDFWSARCEEPQLVTEARLVNETGPTEKPSVVLSVRQPTVQPLKPWDGP